MNRDDYVYDDASGEWLPAAELAARAAAARADATADAVVAVRDAVGNLLADGDQVTLVRDLEVKGAGQTLKRSTLIKSIRLTGDAQEIDAATTGSRASSCAPGFLRKRTWSAFRSDCIRSRAPGFCFAAFYLRWPCGSESSGNPT